MSTQDPFGGTFNLMDLVRGRRSSSGPSWGDVSSKLDPFTSPDDYNKIRLQYFRSVIYPNIAKGKSAYATYQEFLKNTEREPLLDPFESALMRPAMTMVRFMEGALPRDSRTEEAFRSIHDVARREGVEPIAGGVAELAGGLLHGIAVGEVLGPLLGKAADAAELTGFTHKVIQGGLANAAYEVLEAKDGDRVAAGLKGAAWGTVAELGLGRIFGYSEKAAEQATTAAMNDIPGVRRKGLELYDVFRGEPGSKFEPGLYVGEKRIHIGDVAGPSSEFPVDDWAETLKQHPSMTDEEKARAIAALKERAEQERVEREMGRGMPPVPGGAVDVPPQRPPGFEEDLGPPTARPLTPGELTAQTLKAEVTAAAARGYPKVGPLIETSGIKGLRVITRDAQDNPIIHDVPRGKQDEVIPQVEEILANGGSIETIQHEPAYKADAGQFLRHFAAKAEVEDQPLRMTVPEGQAEKVAKQLNKMGLRGTVIDASTVQVGPESAKIMAERARTIARQIAAWHGGTTPATVDAISKQLMRVGELRNQIRAGAGSRAVHDELHHLSGEIGQTYGLMRPQVGQLGLRYYERAATQTEALESADEVLTRYKGAGEPFGAKIGEKPPAGYPEESRLKGFLSALPGWRDHEFDVDELTGDLRVRPVGTTKWLDLPAESIGFHGAQTLGPEGPMRFLAKNATKGDFYEESVHDGLMHADLHNQVPRLMEGHEETAGGIMDGLRENYSAYRKMDPASLANEAAAKAFRAIREGDEEALAQLAEWDTSEGHVKAFANTVAGRTYAEALGKQQTAPIRALQRRMLDMVRRTGNVTEGLTSGQMMGFTTWYDPEIAGFVMRDGNGREIVRKTLQEVHDTLEQFDPSDHSTDVANRLYFSGIRSQGFVPPGSEPRPGTGHIELERVPVGVQALMLGRPALDRASGIQKVLTKLGYDPQMYYGPFRRAEDAVHDAHRSTLEVPGAERDAILKGLNDGQKMHIGELLARPDTDWSAMSASDALNIDGADLQNARMVSDWDGEFAQGRLKPTLETLRRIREAGGDLGRVSGDADVIDAVRKGLLGYDDLHIGRVSKWVMRQNYLKALEPNVQELRGLQKIFSKTTSISSEIDNYIRYAQGVPDDSQGMLKEFMDGLARNINSVLGRVNKNLPPELQHPPVDFKQAFTTLRTLVTAGGLGGRASTLMRDVYGGLQGMMAIGPTAWMDGVQRFMTAEGRAEADAAGALLHNRNVNEAIGDIVTEVPTGRIVEHVNRFANAILMPNRMAHNIGRNATFLGEKYQALRELARLDSGAITTAELRNNTSIFFHDLPEQTHLLGIASDRTIPIEERARQIALSATRATQYGGIPGNLLRTGMGRMLGQYASWPMNHIEFTKKVVWRAVDNPKVGVPRAALWLGINYGAFEAAKAAGVDVTKWLGFSPAGWVGSPPLEFVQNVLKMPEESEVGRKARHDVLLTPFELLPGGVEIMDVYRALNKGNLTLQDILGFRKLKEDSQEADDLESEFIRELGFKPKDFE